MSAPTAPPERPGPPSGGPAGPGGRSPLPAEVRRRVGAVEQLVSVERVALEDGVGRGTVVLVVRNPAGISFEVLVDRALDLGSADAAGMPLAWRSPRGWAAGSRHEPAGAGWARTFGGGLLSTCGLEATGAPATVAGVAHGLHGRVGHLPAEHVTHRLVDDAGRLAVEITGEVVETALGRPTLRLRRRIVADCTAPRLRVEDEVVNESWVVAGHMFRHHLNLGYPLVDDGTEVRTAAAPAGERGVPGRARDVPDEDRDPPGGARDGASGARDATAGADPAHDLPWRLTVAPGPEPERVRYLRPEDEGLVEVRSPAGPRLRVSFAGAFDWLVLWRDASAGVNVLGVEPSTSRDGGRAEAEADGEVVWLAPGESRRYVTEIELVV